MFVHAHTPSLVPPAPSTPVGSSTPFGPSASVDVAQPKAPRAKRGTKLEYDNTGNEPEKAELPKTQDSVLNKALDRLHVDTLRAMVKKEKLNIKSSGMNKYKLLSAIKSKIVVKD